MNKIFLTGALVFGWVVSGGIGVQADTTTPPELKKVIEEESEEMKAEAPMPNRMEASSKAPTPEQMEATTTSPVLNKMEAAESTSSYEKAEGENKVLGAGPADKIEKNPHFPTK